ncbi:MAG: hypothetical protein Q8934_07410 [Bacillota bacterium]|nr:hypothetical protein [Bacillota bacterium]
MVSFKKMIRSDLNVVQSYIGVFNHPTKIVVYGALLSLIATILQSAGFFGGIGFLFSALSTLPILLSCILSLRMGFITYLVTFLLLFIIQPSELITYPLTTGILGLGMGLAFRLFKKELPIALFSGIFLTLGIMIALYIIKFPLLGPSVESTINIKTPIMIFLFSFIYSWGWIKLFVYLVKKFNGIWKKKQNNVG